MSTTTLNQYNRDEVLIAITSIDNTRSLFMDQDGFPVYTDNRPGIDAEIVINKIIQMRNDKPLNELRKLRDQLLFESDVYMLSDYPITQQQKSEILDYRQSLRNLPQVIQSSNTQIDINNLYQLIPTKPLL